MTSTLLTGLFGVALGMRHALEPDHLAAVSTLATEQKSARAGLALGALWGLGHSLTLLVVGGSLVLLEAHMPESLTATFELLVSAMVIALGIRAVRRAFREGTSGPLSTHRHGDVLHTHPAPPAHLHVEGWTLSTRPLFIGIAHGLAGSGALTTVVLLELPAGAARFSYIVLFGAGSVLGMTLLTGLAGLSVRQLARAPRLASGLLGTTGAVSVGIGCWWAVVTVSQLLTS